MHALAADIFFRSPTSSLFSPPGGGFKKKGGGGRLQVGWVGRAGGREGVESDRDAFWLGQNSALSTPISRREVLSNREPNRYADS